MPKEEGRPLRAALPLFLLFGDLPTSGPADWRRDASPSRCGAGRRRSRSTRPIASQTISRSQLSAGSENISIRQRGCRGSAPPAPAGSGTAARRSGFVLRMISTAAQTITKANSVPMFVRCSRASIGRKPASDGHEDADQDRALPRRPELRVDVAEEALGAPGRRGPSPGRRAGRLSIMTSSTDVMPATPADGDDELRPTPRPALA